MSPRATGFAAVVNLSVDDGFLGRAGPEADSRTWVGFPSLRARIKSFGRQAAEPRKKSGGPLEAFLSERQLKNMPTHSLTLPNEVVLMPAPLGFGPILSGGNTAEAITLRG